MTPPPENRAAPIGLLVATEWEARGLVQGLALRKTGPGLYESRDLKNAILLRISGMGQARARAAAESLLSAKPSIVLSAGFAGALQESVNPGDLVLDASRSDPTVIAPMEDAARKKKIPFHRGAFWSGDRPLMRGGEKKVMGLKTGAIAVEMEGQSIFLACRERGVPFCAVRAVSDACGQDLPSSIAALEPDGKTGLRFWKSLAAHPREWPDLIRLARSSAKAGKNLTAVLKEFLCAV